MPMPESHIAAPEIAALDIGKLAQSRTLDVAILLFPDVEVLDFAGPFEVFSVASRIARDRAHAPFRVSTVAARRTPVPARHGLPVIANFSFDEQPKVDLLIVPGGIVDQPLGDPATLAWLAAASREAALTASVCTGAFLLAKLGLLDGLTATSHWEDIPDLRRDYPAITVVENVPFVDQGRIVTSAGISAGIAMSLHLVGRILGVAAAQATARQMQYEWMPEPAIAA
jgi:transcriptional regulator GlxA family with amidase domain